MAPKSGRRKSRAKPNLATLSVDEFFASAAVDDDGDDDGAAIDEKEAIQDERVEPAVLRDDGGGAGRHASQHKQDLVKLRHKDPEFYKFLEENDRSLLNFNDSDTESDSDGDPRVHRPPKRLKEAPSGSDDDSDLDDDDEEEERSKRKPGRSTSSAVKVTADMVSQWREAVRGGNLSPGLLRDVTLAFSAAVAATRGGAGGPDSATPAAAAARFKVEGGTVFNALVSCAVRDLAPALDRLLQLRPSDDAGKVALPNTSRLWRRVRRDVRTYLCDVLQLAAVLAEPSVLRATLRHAHALVPYYLSFPKLARRLLRSMVRQWSAGSDDSCRVLAFLALARVTRHNLSAYHGTVVRAMYLAYVRNARFSSPDSLPLVGFMQRCLCEVLAMDPAGAHAHAFAYVRQLAVHLRGALATRRRDSFRTVYNWQFVRCVELWCRALPALNAAAPGSAASLVYPLAQVAWGCARLVPSERFYPLRLHVARALTELSAGTGAFVPVLPLLGEVLERTDFNRRPGRLSTRPINFATTLRLSRAELQEKSFCDGLVEQLCDATLEHLRTHAHRVAFPELVLPFSLQLRAFLKRCKVANYCRQARQLLDKLTENSTFVSGRRGVAGAPAVTDVAAVEAWEERLLAEGTPLSRYYDAWKRLREHELRLEVSGKERMEDAGLPAIVKRRRAQAERDVDKDSDRKELTELFPSDDEDDDDGEVDDDGAGDDEEDRSGSLIKVKKKKGAKKSDDDDVDFDMDDFSGSDLEGLSDSEDEVDVRGNKKGNKVEKMIEKEKEAKGKKGKERAKPIPVAVLKDLAEGGDDVVEDLALSSDEG
ncbi:nucleolar complex protein 2 homolog [Petromyzon marinus]|uniref:Nucleolar complex protein 2 homolog n=1 Tax=Petromyzon marinus TaxID=7757 RepID=A0AAJ7WM13_PETMA|nr:nucleolar complex protein 2 homolog [Petromyzon marinus]